MRLIRNGIAKVAIVDDADLASFEATTWSTSSVISRRSTTPARAATVEVFCVQQWVLLSGTKTPSADRRLSVVVPSIDDDAFHDERPEQQGPLGHSLSVGLPDDYAQTITSGLTRFWSTSGELRVTGGAIDPVDSSPMVAQIAGEILAIVLHREEDELSERDEDLVLAAMRRR